jgi:RsiW-degrading membrane proteinase PrsW (M82 family)
MGNRDPIEAHGDGTRDLYDISTWEPRSTLDRLAVRLYHGVLKTIRLVVVLLAGLILLSQFLLGSIGATFAEDPYSVGLVLLSVVPALGLAAYVYVADVTSSEPLELLVGTFMLGILFAGFAAVLNTVLGPVVRGVPSTLGVLGIAALDPERVRLYAYRDRSFDAVIDGAVYGAAAGLGFATIENALYITRNLNASGNEFALGAALGAAGLGWVAAALADLSLPVAQSSAGGIIGIVGTGGRIAALRALAGPGHVIYSAFAGYYLGLAKFNSENAGPIVVKGLLIAAFIHATYNTAVTYLPALVDLAGLEISTGVAFLGFILVYDGVFGYLLYRKIARYRSAYKQTDMGRRVSFGDAEPAGTPEADERESE